MTARGRSVVEEGDQDDSWRREAEREESSRRVAI